MFLKISKYIFLYEQWTSNHETKTKHFQSSAIIVDFVILFLISELESIENCIVKSFKLTYLYNNNVQNARVIMVV